MTIVGLKTLAGQTPANTNCSLSAKPTGLINVMIFFTGVLTCLTLLRN